MPYPARPLEDRFWERVEKSGPDACWPWRGSRMPKGYGRISRSGDGFPLNAHRVSWELHHGPIPEGMYVCHRCDNPPCVNPSHLFLGTPADNQADMHGKGRCRAPAGAKHPHAKLSQPIVEKIFDLRKTGMSAVKIGKATGVGWRTVYRVLARQDWVSRNVAKKA